MGQWTPAACAGVVWCGRADSAQHAATSAAPNSAAQAGMINEVQASVAASIAGNIALSLIDAFIARVCSASVAGPLPCLDGKCCALSQSRTYSSWRPCLCGSVGRGGFGSHAEAAARGECLTAPCAWRRVVGGACAPWPARRGGGCGPRLCRGALPAVGSTFACASWKRAGAHGPGSRERRTGDDRRGGAQSALRSIPPPHRPGPRRLRPDRAHAR